MGLFELQIATIAICVTLYVVESRYLLVKIIQQDEYEKIAGDSTAIASFRSKDQIPGILILVELRFTLN